MKLYRFKNSILSYLIGGILIGILIVIFGINFGKDTEFKPVEERIFTYRVEKVIDGDTIRLDNDEVIRLIGVDTPESNHSEVPVQVFSKEACQFTRQLCEGFKVYLEFDNEKKGKYGRTLAYVYLEDGRMVNEELLKRGYAYVLRRFPFKKKQEFLMLQENARKENRGLWSLNLSYGRLANIATKFDALTEEGKRKFDRQLDKLLEKYTQEEQGIIK